MFVADFRERFMRRFWMIALMMALGTVLGRAQQTALPGDTPLPQDQLAAKKIKPPVPIKWVEARFSDEARRNKISGRCLVSIIVDTNGNPQDLKIVRCMDPSFEQTSLEAVQQYRFKPATTQDGQPVAVSIYLVINYVWYNGFKRPIDMQIRYGFSAPPGTLSTEPNANGVYSLTQAAFPPSMAAFSDEGYGELAFLSIKDTSACDILLTISAKGKASDPVVTHCVRPELEKPAIDSLLKSKYKPGSVNGKVVPMRANIHLEYGDVPAKP
jgi:TonB family protein